MPPEANCSIHSDRPAVGNCSRCQKPYCLDCLDMETGKILCMQCLKGGVPANAPAPAAPKPFPAPAPAPVPKASPLPGASPLNFKGKSLEDDPLGLFSGASAPKTTPSPSPPPKPEPLKPAMPAGGPPVSRTINVPIPSGNLGSLDDLDNLSSGPRPVAPVPAPTSTTPPKATLPTGPAPGHLSLGKSPFDLGGLSNESQPDHPSFSPGPAPAFSPLPLEGAGGPMPFPSPVPGMTVGTSGTKNFFSLGKIWAKYLVRRAYKIFDPVAKKLRVPTYVVLAVLAFILAGGILLMSSIANRPSLAIASSVPPLHLVLVNSSQISEMDITAYSDIQTRLQALGFTPLIQMTVPQLPSPNFFDVGMKDDAGVYSEILKMPGQITPYVSYVTVFTNGIWLSTNAWQGKSHETDYLISEFDPGTSPEDLYVKHKQNVDKLKQEKDWQVQAMSENRYIAALSDHLRWFLVKKDIPAYQADFALWN
jgi:hypothetical protein